MSCIVQLVDDYLQRCQVKPAAVKSDDIDALFEHKMYRTIVSVFFPLPPNQIRSDYYSFLVQSVPSMGCCYD